MEINIYNEYGNIIIFPNLLFLILTVIIGVCAYKMKKYSSVGSLLLGLYLSFIICTLFFPIVIDWGDAYNFRDDFQFMIVRYRPIDRILSNPLYSFYHLIMFIPLGYIMKKEMTLKKTIFWYIILVLGLENIQLLINLTCHYVQYTYDTCDMTFHFTSLIVGMLFSYIPINKLRNQWNEKKNIKCKR
jgi:hypothetical protein